MLLICSVRCCRGWPNSLLAVPIIDLDTPPPAGVERAPLPLPRRLIPPRPARVLVVVLLTLAGLGAAAPSGRGIRHLLSAGGQPASAFVLSDDALFTASFGNSPNSDSAVRRWDLPGGALRWSIVLPQNVQNLVYDNASNVLMGRSGNEPMVVFLDAGTGAVLWRDQSPNTSVVNLFGGQALIQTAIADRLRELRLVDARTGRPVWSRELDATGYLDAGDQPGTRPTRIIAVDQAGHTIVLRYADGSVLAEGDLGVNFPVQLDSAFGADFAGVSAVGDVLYVSRRESGASTLTAWSIDSLIRRWQTAGGPVGWVVDCGVVLCMAEDGLVSALDPAGGRVLWQSSGLGFAYRYDDRTLLAYDQSDNPRSVLLDPRTGSVLARLGSVVQLREVLLRTDSVRIGRTWVQAYGGDGALHAVGALDTVAPFGCELRGPYLACPTTAGPTQVWWLPSHLT
jgi:outer membrane protein assembly factor BamB